jgi:hypothetical protein
LEDRFKIKAFVIFLNLQELELYREMEMWNGCSKHFMNGVELQEEIRSEVFPKFASIATSIQIC